MKKYFIFVIIDIQDYSPEEYIKKSFKGILAVILTILLSAAIIPVSSYPAGAAGFVNNKGSVKVVCGKYEETFTAKKNKNNFTKAFKKALDAARKKATDKKKATVTVSKGNYNLTETLYIYSNTTFNAGGSAFRSAKGNHLKNGFDKLKKSAKAYGGARNITVIGGTWDANVPFENAEKVAKADGSVNAKYTNSSLRFAHCKNLTVKNAKFKNNYNSHDIELGGVDGAKITGCEFSNDKSMNTLQISGGVEAVQIDVNIKKAMDNFESYDKTSCKNINVSNNKFVNKYRAVGTHHSVLGKPYDNITVSGNTVVNGAGIAINGVYWRNAKIFNNTLTDVGSGIDLHAVDDHNMYNLDNLTAEKIENAMKSSSSYIYGNKVKIRAEDNNNANMVGVRASGSEITQASDDTAPVGTYYIYNAKIGVDEKGKSAPNIVNGSFAEGAALRYSKDSSIQNSNVDLTNCTFGKFTAGVYVYGCVGSKVSSNVVTASAEPQASEPQIPETTAAEPPATESAVTEPMTVPAATEPAASVHPCYGMSIRISSDTEVYDNSITAPNDGIRMLNGCDGTVIYDNNLTSYSNNCVYLSGKEDSTPTVSKSLTVTGNKMSCINNARETAAVQVYLSTIELTAFSNTFNSLPGAASEYTEPLYSIKGDNGRAVNRYGDVILNELADTVTDDGITLSWENAAVNGYLVSRYIDGVRFFTNDTAELTYTDTYVRKIGRERYYTVTPYLLSGGIKLYSKSNFLKFK